MTEPADPNPPRTLPALLAASTAEHGGRDALVTLDTRVTYEELAAQVERMAGALVAHGVGKGARVGLLAENDPDWIVVALATASIGAILVPVTTFAKADDLAYWIRHTDLSLLVCTDRFLGNDYLDALRSLAPELDTAPPGRLFSTTFPALRTVIVRPGTLARRSSASTGAPVPAGCVPWSAFLAAAEHVPVDVVRGLVADVDPEDEAYLLSTSGTTARPKGVLLTHDALARNGRQIGDCQQLVADDVVWAYFPLFFSAGCINVLLGTLSHGATLLVQPSFDPGEALELIDREGATVWHLWPHQLTALMEHPSWHDKRHDRLHKGTGPYDLIQTERAADGLGGVNMYGMTETSTAFACTSAADPVEVRIGSQGLLLPGNELLVVDPDTAAPLPDGERGELWVKGPTLLRRYYKVDPAETFTDDGWFRTGDLGWIDADGRVHFDQRAKDVIKTGGINVSPADVEASLARASGVRAAYVFALPDAERGEVVGAAIVIDDDGYQATADALTTLCRDELPGYKRPHAVLALHAGDVPMTASGKVQKFALRDQLLARLAATPTPPWLLGPVDSQ